MQKPDRHLAEKVPLHTFGYCDPCDEDDHAKCWEIGHQHQGGDHRNYDPYPLCTCLCTEVNFTELIPPVDIYAAWRREDAWLKALSEW